MSTLQQLQAQRATFISAWQQGKITLAQRDQALAANQQQINALQVSQPTVSPTPTTPIAPQQTPQNIPTNMGPVPVATFEAGAKDPTMQNVVIPALEVAGIAALSAIPCAAPVVLGGAAIGVGAKVGIDSAVKSYETGQAQLVLPKTVREVTDTAIEGAALSAIGGGAVSAVGRAAPVIVKQVAGRVAVNAGVNAAISGGASGIASGGNPQAILEGAAFGAALGLGGEAVGAAAGKVASIPKVNSAIQNVKDVTVGTKFTEITGVKEVNIQTTKGMETSVTRITQPELKTITLKGNDAKFYRENNLGTLQNPTIELAGTQRISTVTKDEAGILQEITRYKQPVESTRSAEPILSAIKGETLQAGKVKVGEVAEFLKTPSDYSAVEKVKIEAGRGRVDLDIDSALRKHDVPVTKLEKVVATNRDAILPVSEVSARDFTGVQLRGKIDASIYADPAKALPTDLAQNIYKKLGGGVNQGSGYFDTPTTFKGKVKPFDPDVPSGEAKLNLGSADDNLKLVKRDSKSSDSGMEGITKQVGRTEGKTDVQLSRSIVGEVKGATSKPKFIPVVTAGITFEHLNTQNQNYNPSIIQKSAPDVTKLVTPSVITPIIDIKIVDNSTDDIQPVISKVVLDEGGGSRQLEKTTTIPTDLQAINEEKKVIHKGGLTKTTPKGIPDIIITPDITPIVTPYTPPVITPKVTPDTTPNVTPIEWHPIPPVINIPPVSKTKTRSSFGISLGGGSGSGGLGVGKASKWYVKRHKVKTASQMLKTFGVGVGSSKADFKTSSIKISSLATSKQRFKTPKMLLGNGNVGKVDFNASGMKLNKTVFKASNIKIGKSSSFNAGFSSNQFNKMFQQPKTKRRR